MYRGVFAVADPLVVRDGFGVLVCESLLHSRLCRILVVRAALLPTCFQTTA